MAFEQVWSAFQHELQVGDTIPNWTQDSGLIGRPFVVAALTQTAISVDPGGSAATQHVPKAHFESVFMTWSGYRAGQVRRPELRDITRFSKYIISLLRWLEARHGGTLPE